MSSKQAALVSLFIALFLAIPAWGQYESPNERARQNQQSGAMMPGSSQRPSAQMPEATSGRQQDMRSSQQSWAPRVEKAQKLLGYKLRNTRNDSLGTVQDLVIDRDEGRIAYAVVARGGIMGVGEKFVAVPYAALQPRIQQSEFILNAEKDQIEKAPSFSSSNWPNMADPSWQRDTDQYFGQTAQFERSREQMGRMESHQPGMSSQQRDMTSQQRGMESRQQTMGQDQFVRISQLQHFQVQDTSDQAIGRVKDVMIDMTEGRPVYALVSLDVPDARDKLSVIPWDSVEMRSGDQQIMHVDADASTLKSVAFASSAIPDLSNPQTAQNIHETFGREPYWNVYGYMGGERASESEAEFNMKSIETVSGTIEKYTTRMGPKGVRFVQVSIRTSDGKLVNARLAPESFLREKGLQLSKGDMITVTGSRLGSREKARLHAQRIDKGGQTITLRDEQGRALWKSERSGQSGQMRSGESMQQNQSQRPSQQQNPSQRPQNQNQPSGAAGSR